MRGFPDIFRIVWHHLVVADDRFPHVLGGPTDCYCEPEVDDLGNGPGMLEHRVVRHQDMGQAEVTDGTR